MSIDAERPTDRLTPVRDLYEEDAPRSVPQAMFRGFLCRCPQCGQGRMFGAFLKVKPHCESCGEALDLHRADDAPPYIVIFIVGHIVVALNLMADRSSDWPLWVHFALWPTLALAMCLALLQPVKGAMVGLQWAARLHGFDPSGDVHDVKMRVAQSQSQSQEPR